MRNKSTLRYEPKSIGLGFCIFILAISVFLSSCGSKGFPNADKILAAVPEKYKENPEEYILKSVEFSARLQKELEAARNTRIPVSLQDQITNKISKSTARLNESDVIQSQGVNFQFASIINSMILCQSNESEFSSDELFDLTLPDYGLYVEFGAYPSEKPDTMNVDPNFYNENFSNRTTAILKYTKIVGGDTLLLKVNDAVVADDLGFPCPRYCPK
ncbi:MAG: hypothetical protein U0T36_09470 [Saprospiraceae bacterium]|jgi:hypothetical protein